MTDRPDDTCVYPASIGHTVIMWPDTEPARRLYAQLTSSDRVQRKEAERAVWNVVREGLLEELRLKINRTYHL